MKRSYEDYVTKYSDKFLRVKVDPDYILKIQKFVSDLVNVKAREEHHYRDNRSEIKRFTTGFVGEAAIEKLLGIDIIDWNIGYSGLFHHPDIPGYRVGVKTVEFGKFPVIFKDNPYPQIICIKSKAHDNLIFVCGIATIEVLRKYQDTDLIIDPNLRARGSKTGFYGFEHLLPLNSTDDLLPYRK